MVHDCVSGHMHGLVSCHHATMPPGHQYYIYISAMVVLPLPNVTLLLGIGRAVKHGSCGSVSAWASASITHVAAHAGAHPFPWPRTTAVISDGPGQRNLGRKAVSGSKCVMHVRVLRCDMTISLSQVGIKLA